MDVGEFNGRRLYTGLRLDYSLRLWAPTSASHTISVVAELFVKLASVTYRILQLVSQTTYIHYLNIIHLIAHYAWLTSILSKHVFPLNLARDLLATWNPTFGTNYL